MGMEWGLNYNSAMSLLDFFEKELKPVMRKDEVKKFDCRDLFRNVKDKQDTYIRVPKIIE